MAKKEKNNYFDMFVDLVDYCCRAAESLHNTLKNFDPNNLTDTMNSLHEIEHAADNGKHLVMKKLTKEFITPIEREDIISLTQEIDDVTDSIEDVLLKIYMYNIHQIRQDALLFSQTILDCCNALKVTMEEFKNFKRSQTIHDNIVKINDLEEVGDKLYTEAVHKLFTEPHLSSIDIFAWTIAFSKMERCCDACEHTANVVESIIMKNS